MEHVLLDLMLIAHLAIVLAAKWLCPRLDLFHLLVGATISSFDAVPPMFGLRPDSYHCGGVFHSIWVPIAGAVLLYPFGVMPSASFLVGGMLHLASDSIDREGRPWLYPISKRKHGFSLLPYAFSEYVSNPICISLELISGVSVVSYLLFIGIDQASVFWLMFVTPFFIAFALRERSLGKDQVR